MLLLHCRPFSWTVTWPTNKRIPSVIRRLSCTIGPAKLVSCTHRTFCLLCLRRLGAAPLRLTRCIRLLQDNLVGKPKPQPYPLNTTCSLSHAARHRPSISYLPQQSPIWGATKRGSARKRVHETTNNFFVILRAWSANNSQQYLTSWGARKRTRTHPNNSFRDAAR